MNRPTSPNPSSLGVSALLTMLILGCGSPQTGPVNTPAANSQPTDAARTATECIATPEEWRQHWERGETRCVAPWLFATVYFPPHSEKPLDSYLYPCTSGNPCNDGFRYAWAFSNTNLELFLELKERYPDDPTKVSSAIFSLIGFTGIETFEPPGERGTGVNLAIYTLPVGESPVVPTWEAWFRMLDELAAETAVLTPFVTDEDIQSRYLRAQQELVHAYANLDGKDSRHHDDVHVYSRLSGCPREAMITAPNQDGTGSLPDYLGLGYAPPDLAQTCTGSDSVCWDDFDPVCGQGEARETYLEYKGFLNAADLKSPYTGDADSRQCFVKALQHLQSHREKISATTLRATLAQCQDASMLNTGAGLGYNTYPNPTSYQDECGAYWDPEYRPDEQSVPERLTGREFIVLNRQLTDLPEQAQVALEFTSEHRPYLVDGYCGDG